MFYTIWKTLLQVADIQTVRVPEGAEFLCAREQHDMICVWYRCNTSQPLMLRKIVMVGTGHPTAPEKGRYLGSAFLSGGALVFHVFEVD